MTDRMSEDEIDHKLVSKRKRIQNYQTRKTTMKWIGIIVIIMLIVIILVNVVPPLLEKFNIVDTYSPHDLERQYHQTQKLREGEPDKMQNVKGY